MTPLYIIASCQGNDEIYFWSDISGWGDLESAEVYTEYDLKFGVRLPIDGYWLRIAPDGVTRISETEL